MFRITTALVIAPRFPRAAAAPWPPRAVLARLRRADCRPLRARRLLRHRQPHFERALVSAGGSGSERRDVHGGAYIGVGPDQDFSYIAGSSVDRVHRRYPPRQSAAAPALQGAVRSGADPRSNTWRCCLDGPSRPMPPMADLPIDRLAAIHQAARRWTPRRSI